MSNLILSAVILEDEPQARECLHALLDQYCPEVAVVAEFADAPAAHQYLMEHPVDLLFSDIDLPNMDGFSFLELMPQRNFEVVLVTGHPEYALQAIRTEVLDYLVKPVNVAELRRAVGRLCKRKARVPLQAPDVAVHKTYAQEGPKLTVPTGAGAAPLDLALADGSVENDVAVRYPGLVGRPGGGIVPVDSRGRGGDRPGVWNWQHARYQFFTG